MDTTKVKPRSKTFVSMDSLWYEEERLATFIEWPLSFIHSEDLANDGFYYLRTKDHCACAFCRGIIGAWEERDTPRGEHKRHFPHCPFIQGKVTPNVPLKQCDVLNRISKYIPVGRDTCGTGKELTQLDKCTEGRVFTVSSDPNITISKLGFRQYCGPKRKDFLTYESRLKSFTKWPEKVKQDPKDLADAGFYYCGLSDHVRCFHCGNGLRNFEDGDDPWEEHARWFSDCHYILLKKGIEFVDKVKREKPPYIPVRRQESGAAASSSQCSSEEEIQKGKTEIDDSELEKLMELEIMKHVLEMGFVKHVVKKALKSRLIESGGQPFFSVEYCIEAVLHAMEMETTNTIQGCEDITRQAKKMAALDPQSDPGYYSASEPSSRENSQQNSQSGNSELTSSRHLRTERVEDSQQERQQDGSSEIVTSTEDVAPNNVTNATMTSILPPLPNRTLVRSSPLPPLPISVRSSPLPPLPISRASPPLRSSTPTYQIGMAIFEPMDGVETTDVEVQEPSPADGLLSEEQTQNNAAESADIDERPMEIQQSTASATENTENSPTEEHPTEQPNSRRLSRADTQELPAGVGPLISEAEGIIKQAAKLLAPSSSSSGESSSSSLSSNSSFRSSFSSSQSSYTSSPASSQPSSLTSEHSVTSEHSSLTSEPSSLTSNSSEESTSSESSNSSTPQTTQALSPVHEATGETDLNRVSAKENRKDNVDVESRTKQPSSRPDDLALELERIRENRMCKVCMDKEMDVVFLPCTHMVTCSSCAVALAQCPICRRDIQYAFKPIIS